MNTISKTVSPQPEILSQIGFAPVQQPEGHNVIQGNWKEAYMMVKSSGEQKPVKIPLTQSKQAELLGSVKIMTEHPDSKSVMAFEHSIEEVMADFQSQWAQNPDLQAYLWLDNGVTQLAIPLERLEKNNLVQALENALQQTSQPDMQHAQSQLSGLAQDVRASMNLTPAEPVNDWFSALISWVWDGPVDLLTEFVGYSWDSVNSIMSSLVAELIDSLAKSFGVSSTPASEKAQELVRIANQLAQELDLTATIEGPDVSQLIRQFMQIIRELDVAMTKLLAQSAKKIQSSQSLQRSFAERLLGNDQFHQQKQAMRALNASQCMQLVLLKWHDKLLAKAELLAKVDLATPQLWRPLNQLLQQSRQAVERGAW